LLASESVVPAQAEEARLSTTDPRRPDSHAHTRQDDGSHHCQTAGLESERKDDNGDFTQTKVAPAAAY